MPAASNTNQNDAWEFAGFSNPNTTQVPDEVFDLLAPRLKEAELRVLLYIIRRTFGFKKNADSISLTQLVHGIKTRDGRIIDLGTGMSKPGVIKGLNGLLQKKIITVEKKLSEQGDNEINVYRLRFQEQEKTGVVNNVDYRSKQRSLGVVNEVDPQNTVIQHTVNNTVNGVVKGGERSEIQRLKDLEQPPEKTAYLAEEMVRALGDAKSQRFYELVAAKVPEAVIRETLAEIKADGARSPARLFTYRMQRYALEQRKRGVVKGM
jgi:hypothetical protein